MQQRSLPRLKAPNGCLLSLLLLSPLTISCMSQPDVPYRPVVRSQDQLVVAPSPPEAEHLDNIKRVFDFYNVPYREVDQQLLVPAEIWRDQEMMWNYTTKANDPEWLRQQQEEGWIE